MKHIQRVVLTATQRYNPEHIRLELQGTPTQVRHQIAPPFEMLFSLISNNFTTAPPLINRGVGNPRTRVFNASRLPGITSLVETALDITERGQLAEIWAGKNFGSTNLSRIGTRSKTTTVLFPLVAAIEIKPGFSESDNSCELGEVLVALEGCPDQVITATQSPDIPRARNTVRIMDFIGVNVL